METIHHEVISSLPRLKKLIPLFMGRQYIGIDTETTGLDPYLSKLRLIQIAISEGVFIIDLFHLPNAGPLLQPLFFSERPIKIFHNAKFDLKMLSHHLDINVRGVFDTMLASQLITAGTHTEGHSLEQVVEKFLGVTVDKTEQRSDWSVATLSLSQLEYAARDAQLLIPLYKAQRARLIELGLVRAGKLEFDCVLSIAAMELDGILLDTNCWKLLVEDVKKEHTKLASELKLALEPGLIQPSLFDDAQINLDSPNQVLAAFNNLGIPLTGTRSGQMLKLADDYPVIDQFLEYRGLQKLLTSYGMNMLRFIHPITGRIHADFFQLGAHSGRLACHSPNIQQIPKSIDYRSCFVAPPGRKLVVADYAQIELKILADWANDKVLIDSLCSGMDLHITTASQMFGLPLNEVTAKHRAAAKSLNYGLVYGMGAKGLAARIKSSLSEAKQLINQYFATYKGVASWLRRAAEQAVKTKQSRSKSGRLICYEFDENDDNEVSSIMRYGKNTPIQGTSADITKRAMALLHQSFLGTTAKMVNSVHDELVFEIDDSDVEQKAKQVEELMVAAGKEFLPQVPVTVDLKISQSWVK